MAMIPLITANVKAGEDFTKLSLIFSRTRNPASINKLSPIAAKSNTMGKKYSPINKPAAPIS